jgi:hypothetical protein
LYGKPNEIKITREELEELSKYFPKPELDHNGNPIPISDQLFEKYIADAIITRDNSLAREQEKKRRDEEQRQLENYYKQQKNKENSVKEYEVKNVLKSLNNN